MKEEKLTDNFRRIVVIGSAQVAQMLVTLIRAKLIAVLFGSAGVGINAIFQTTVTSLASLCSLGVHQSAVRDISQAKTEGDIKRIGHIVSIIDKLILSLAFIGLFMSIILSAPIAYFSFDSNEYLFSFVILSFAVPLLILTNGKNAILQGTHSSKFIAYSSLWGAFFSLLICIPLYCYIGIRGIALSIVLGYFFQYVIKSYYVAKLKINTESLPLRLVISESCPIISLGFYLMIGSFSITLFSYLTNICLAHIGSISDVGLYQGAVSITTQSIAVILFVLSSDFYPRISGVIDDKEKVGRYLTSQLKLILYITSIIVLILLLLGHQIITLLLSDSFLIIIPVYNLMAISLIFRVVWIIMSYVILAKGDKKSYIVYDAIGGNGLMFIMNITSYKLWGLNALGWSFLLASIFVSLILVLVVMYKYRINIESRVYYFVAALFVALMIMFKY